MTSPLPHDPYILAVVRALLAAGMEPDGWWTSDAEIDPYATGDDAGCTKMLNAVLLWSGDHTAVGDAVFPDGLLLLWDHPAEQWQCAERRAGGGNEEPEFVASLPRWIDPAVAVIVVRELLAGRPAPTTVGPLWLGHEQAQSAVDAWADEVAPA
jgi:hypothetical protein